MWSWARPPWKTWPPASVGETVEKLGTLFGLCWWDCEVWPFLRGLHRELPADPAIPLLGVCPKEVKMAV